MALRVASAYRTVSDEAVCIIAGTPPIDLLAIERKDVYEARRRANDNTQRVIWDSARKKTMIYGKQDGMPTKRVDGHIVSYQS